MLIVGIPFFLLFMALTRVVGLSVSLACIFAPLVYLADNNGWFFQPDNVYLSPIWLESIWSLPLLMLLGVFLLTVFMHLARSIGRLHAQYAKALLVAPAVAQ